LELAEEALEAFLIVVVILPLAKVANVTRAENVGWT
jgi:hypothetical protein